MDNMWLYNSVHRDDWLKFEPLNSHNEVVVTVDDGNEYPCSFGVNEESARQIVQYLNKQFNLGFKED